MKLTLYSDYSLRMLMHLAANPDKLITISDTAEKYNISKNHLMKVAHHLGKKGYIETIRGRSGGLRLAKDPADLNLSEIVQSTEQNTVLVECFPGGKNMCVISEECRLKSILHEAEQGFFAVLSRFTLADLMTENFGLKALLERSDATKV